VAYLVFRGTDSKRDFLSDLDIRRQNIGKEEGVLVHRGFLEQFTSVEPEIESFMRMHADAFDEIICCGHSMGGALATIAAVYLETCDASPTHQKEKEEKEEKEEYQRRDCICRCYTFGSPRVGNAAFARFFEKRFSSSSRTGREKKARSVRVFIVSDPVVHLPFSCRFQHVDKERGFDLTSSSVRKEDEKYELRVHRCTNKCSLLFSCISTMSLCHPLRHHDVSHYRKAMEALRTSTPKIEHAQVDENTHNSL